MHGKHIRLKAVLSVLLAAGIAAFSVPAPISYAEDSVLELQAQYDKLEQQIKQNQKIIDEKKKESQDQSQIVSEIETEIGGLNSQITILNKKLDLLNAEIDQLSGSISSLDQQIAVMDKQIEQTRENIIVSKIQIDDTYQKVIGRLSKSYMAGGASELELLLGAKSLADVLTWQQYIQNASEYDQTIIDTLNDNLDALQHLETQLDNTINEANQKKEEAKAQLSELESKQADANASADDLTVKKNTANAKRNEAYSLLKTMNAESKEYQQLNEQMRAEEERIDAEMNARLAKIASVQQDPVPQTTAASTTAATTTAATTTTTTTTTKLYVPGQEEPIEETSAESTETMTVAETTVEDTTTTTAPSSSTSTSVTDNSPKARGLICPIQNSHAVVSGTYPYYQGGGVHHGIDIVITDAGKTYGHDVVAPQSGKVITVGYGDASRGNYLEIDHGNGLVTRYYHFSSLSVSLGQTVSKGQVIGKVGDTGNVTGPHLHFEVLLNTTSGLKV